MVFKLSVMYLFYTFQLTSGKNQDRQVPQQPLVLTGNRDIGRRLNRRKLSELPYHYIKLQNWEGMQEHIMDLEFIEAKFEANMVSIFHINNILPKAISLFI